MPLQRTCLHRTGVGTKKSSTSVYLDGMLHADYLLPSSLWSIDSGGWEDSTAASGSGFAAGVGFVWLGKYSVQQEGRILGGEFRMGIWESLLSRWFLKQKLLISDNGD